MSFEHLMPIEDIGLPIGYKYTRSDKKEAIKHSQDFKLKRREKEYSKNILKNNNTVKDADSLKYENYFKLPARPKTSLIHPDNRKLSQSDKLKEVKPKPIENEFQQEVRGMIENLEKKVAAENKPYDKDVIAEAKKALMNIAGLTDIDI